MTDDSSQKLKSLLGEDFFHQIVTTSEHEGHNHSGEFTNSRDIFCECKTIILRSKHAKLILPTESMLELGKDVKFLQYNDGAFKNLVQGCYWLVDDMYKFEQIGYTKEIPTQQTLKVDQHGDCQTQQTADTSNAEQKQLSNSLRYLVCAECNLGPLGWFDSKTKESYLYVW